jgi:D-alanine-D-alanine ligase
MIRVGIFFGGRSREREISFAGGRTVYDNLDKAIFEPVPVFVDALGKLTLLNWEFIYKGTIRDFFPGPAVNDGSHPWQVHADSLGQLDAESYTQLQQQIGQPLHWEQLPGLMDMAFLTLHGPFGEDGAIQGILEWLGIPYTGSGIYPSAFGIHKIYQRKSMTAMGFPGPEFLVIKRQDFVQSVGGNSSEVYQQVQQKIGFPCVVKAPHQGSSIGVSVLINPGLEEFSQALARSFFLERIDRISWKEKSESDRILWINAFLDVRTGTGLPVSIYGPDLKDVLHRCYWPEELFKVLDGTDWNYFWLEPDDAEEEVLVEAFIKGKEFSCIVVETPEGEPLALPPTEIIKSSPVFDYRAKYLPGISRKVTPIDVPGSHLEAIKAACERMYATFGFQVYARLDGFVSEEGQVFLNDPNTTSGMLPSSFFFHQAAEIGLNPSQFLTYILHSSLKSRLTSGKSRFRVDGLKKEFNTLLDLKQSQAQKRTRVAVVMGGYSTERHISMESGRNIFEKLSSSSSYSPIPVFLTGSDSEFSLYRLPIKYMLKDNADDVQKLVQQPGPVHPFIVQVIDKARSITSRFASDAVFSSELITLDNLAVQADEVFIALHGRPGEDGSLQEKLEELGLPYNGSGIESSRKTINKYETNALLRKHGIHVAAHRMVYKSDWLDSTEQLFASVEKDFSYPFIAKPSDDGCSSAVKKIKSRTELDAFCSMMFRDEEEKPEGPAKVLQLRPSEEFPQKTGFLIEELIEKGSAKHFLEITGGMLTRVDQKSKRVYEVFEPSETLASGEVLSLEEKFLAGEGQNITPARFSTDPSEQKRISEEVRKVLQRTAEILDVEGYCRIDAFVRVFEDGRVETIIIEINSLPGMTPATCIFHQAAINKLRPLEFIDAILDYGKKKSSLLI